jgi:hypothetical protein
VDVPGNGAATTTMQMYCENPDRDAPFGMLFYYTSNAPGPEATGQRTGRFAAAELTHIHLPYLARSHVRDGG